MLFILKEMVLDKENDKVHPRYLAYDIIRFQVGCFCLFFCDLAVLNRLIKYYLFLLLLTISNNYLNQSVNLFQLLIACRQIFADIASPRVSLLAHNFV